MDSFIYDAVIIGGGPVGLTLAYCFSQLGQCVILIDREVQLGGLHRVRRVDQLFTEHGPRIYLGSYVTFNELLQDMGATFDSFFTPLYPNVLDFFHNVQGLSMHDVWILVKKMILFLISSRYREECKQVTVEEFMNHFDFSTQGREVMDRICRVTDGAGANRYTMYELFMILNQNLFYGIYQPKYPNDNPKSFVSFWKTKLTEQGVTILSDTRVTHLIGHQGNQDIQKVKCQNGRYIYGKRFFCAVPPTDFLHLVQISHLERAVPRHFQEWVEQVKYNIYLPISFHWDQHYSLPTQMSKLPSSPDQSAWGIGHIVLSNYWKDYPHTVISTAIMKLDTCSPSLGKTANQATMEELKEEVWRFLQHKYPMLPPPDAILPSPEIVRDEKGWNTIDQSFVLTKAGHYGPCTNIPNLFWVNTGNGNNNYSFTSLESAVQNALAMVHILYPQTMKKWPVLEPQRTLERGLWVFLFIVLGFTLYVFVKSLSFKSKSFESKSTSDPVSQMSSHDIPSMKQMKQMKQTKQIKQISNALSNIT